MRKLALQVSLIILISLAPVLADHTTNDPESKIIVPDAPEGDWYVLDLAGVISDQTELEYTKELKRVTDESGVTVRLVTVKSMYDASNGSCITPEYYNFCGDEDYFSDDRGYARQMFRHFGMEDGNHPGMLIALSTEDRQFKFVMPDLSLTTQKVSQGVFEAGSHNLAYAADFYEYESGELWNWYEWQREEVCIWEGNQDWLEESDESLNHTWHCGWDYNEDGDMDEWNNWWYLCEMHFDQWWCTDEYGQDPSNKDSANGSLMPDLPDPADSQYVYGNPWEEALSYYVNEAGPLVTIEPWSLPVHLIIYLVGIFGAFTLIRANAKEASNGMIGKITRYEIAKDRLRYAYALRRADLSLKSLKGDDAGTVFETVSDQIEMLSKQLRRDPDSTAMSMFSDEDDYDQHYTNESKLRKTLAELNQRADDMGIPEDITLTDMDMEWEFSQIRNRADMQDRLNRIAFPSSLTALLSMIYLGCSMFAGGTFTLGQWAIDNPGLLFYNPVSEVGIVIILISTIAFVAVMKIAATQEPLINAIAPPRSPFLPFSRPITKLGVSDYHNVVIPAFLAGTMVAGGYSVTSAGLDEHGNEIYETHRQSSSSSDGGGGGGCGGGGCGGGGCGGGGGF